MMNRLIYNPDDYETVSDYKICSFHKEHPGESFANCVCTGSISLRRKNSVKKETKPDNQEFVPSIHLPEKL